jgi:glutathione synthase/RimK-type ligase-like ATP-grasp enzyme
VSIFKAIADLLSRPQVLIHGRYSPWLKALGPGAAIWSRLDSYEVGRSNRLGLLPTWRRRYVIPLFQWNFRTMHRPAWALVPNRAAIAVCTDKRLFARFCRLHGLGADIPATWDRNDPITFPAVLKRTDLLAGQGVVIVPDAATLAARLRERTWSRHPVIVQEFIPGDVDETLHVVCVAGKIVWHLAHLHQLASASAMRPAPDETSPQRSLVSAADLAVFSRFFAALNYDGPACIDFKRRPDGRITVLEINPRMGGTLMRPNFTADRAQAVAAILAHARLHGLGEDDFSATPQ